MTSRKTFVLRSVLVYVIGIFVAGIIFNNRYKDPNNIKSDFDYISRFDQQEVDAKVAEQTLLRSVLWPATVVIYSGLFVDEMYGTLCDSIQEHQTEYRRNNYKKYYENRSVK